jgi:GMP synthase-like glutamine amidotransferase
VRFVTAARSGHWAVIQHTPEEGPGLISEVAHERGLDLVTWPAYAGAPPPDPADLDGAVLMGGPMSILDANEIPYLQAEQAFVGEALRQCLPLLGICLGAQLIAAAAGATVYRGERPELGVGMVEVTAAGREDPVMGDLDAPTVIHWHEDGFTLPRSAVRLAATPLYPNQAFRVGRNAYGLQFHIEFDRDHLNRLGDYLPPEIRHCNRHVSRMEVTGRTVAERFFALSAPAPRERSSPSSLGVPDLPTEHGEDGRETSERMARVTSGP